MQVIVNVLHAFRDLIAVTAAVFQLRHSLCEIRDKFGVYRVYLLWRTCKVCFSYIEVAEVVSSFAFHSALNAETRDERHRYNQVVFQITQAVGGKHAEALPAKRCGKRSCGVHVAALDSLVETHFVFYRGVGHGVFAHFKLYARQFFM